VGESFWTRRIFFLWFPFYLQAVQIHSANETRDILFVPSHSRCVLYWSVELCVFTAILSLSQYRSCEATQAVGVQISAAVAQRWSEWHGDRLTWQRGYSNMFNWSRGSGDWQRYVSSCLSSAVLIGSHWKGICTCGSPLPASCILAS
jgi:hypothetical protein